VVVDLGEEGLPFGVTLVLANLTAASPELIQHLEQLAEEGPRRFIAVVPLESKEGGATQQAQERLGKLVQSLREHGIVAAGMIGDPDPYTAAMNALQFFQISEVVISTLPGDTSKWVADKLVERVQSASNVPVEHIESRATAGAGA
jgi:precorrin-2 methylase